MLEEGTRKSRKHEKYLDQRFVKYYNHLEYVSLAGIAVRLKKENNQECQSIPPFFSIPKHIVSSYSDESPVVAIDHFAFVDCSKLFGINISDSIRIIGNSAFANCKNLVYVSLGQGMSHIRDSAFKNCKNLTQIKLPENLRVLGKDVFKGAGIREIVFHKGLLLIEHGCFADCPIEHIVIEDPGTEISKSAFSGCNQIRSITAPMQMAGRIYELFGEKLSKISLHWIDCGKESQSPPVYFENMEVEKTVYDDGDKGWTLKYDVTNVMDNSIVLTVDRPFFLMPNGILRFNFGYSGYEIENKRVLPGQTVEGAAVITEEIANDRNFDEWCKLCVPYYTSPNEYSRKERERLEIQYSFEDSPCRNLREVFCQKEMACQTALFTQLSDEWLYLNGEEHIKTPPRFKEILVADFVVKSSIFKCNHNHHIETINASVYLMMENGETKREQIIAGYCSECDCYFILESDFDKISRKGVLLCRLLEEEEYRTKGQAIMFGNEMQDRSLLRRCGYTVNAKDNLTQEQRRGILRYVVDEGLYSVAQVCSFLDWLVDINSRGWQDKSQAISKWQSDRDYISQYGTSNRKDVGVNSIRYRR